MERQKRFSKTNKNRLSDRDMLLDLIITEKHLSSLYDHGALEATSPIISNTFERLQADTHDNARTLFNAMQQRGWYNSEQIKRTGRSEQREYKETSDNFDLTADSKYTVSSGTRNFGQRLANGHRLGKTGIFNNPKAVTNYQERH